MKSINRVQILGNVTRDPDMKYTPNGKAVINFSVACNHSYKNAAGKFVEGVVFVPVVFWGKSAEIIAQYVKKGSKLYVEGRYTSRSWDSPDCTKQYRTEVLGSDFIMMGGGEKKDVQEVAQTGAQADAPAEKTGDSAIDDIF